jgi:hypothetical protein
MSCSRIIRSINSNTLRLRAGKNDNYNPFITDELVRRLWIDLGHVGARGLFCSMYMNAVYKGVFNLTERIREPFFQQHYDSDATWDVNYSGDLGGRRQHGFYQLLSTLDTDLTVTTNWQSVTNQMDIDNAGGLLPAQHLLRDVGLAGKQLRDRA